MATREWSLRNSQNVIVTAGLMCAPLSLPTAERAIVAPVVPNRKPVISRRSPSFGMSRSIGLPVPNIRMTSDSPTSNRRAVPTNSEKNTCQGKRKPFLAFIDHLLSVLFWPRGPPHGHGPYHEHPEREDIEARNRLHDQAGQQDPLPAQHHEQQDCRHQIGRPLHWRRERQKEREPVRQSGHREGQREPLPGESWAGQRLAFLATGDWRFRRQNLDWYFCSHRESPSLPGCRWDSLPP